MATPVQPATAVPTNHNALMDYMMSSTITAYSAKIMESGNKITMKNIAYLMMIFSMSEIKGMVTQLLSEMKRLVSSNYKQFFAKFFQLWYLIRTMVWKRKQIVLPKTPIEVVPTNTSITIDMSGSLEVMNKLVQVALDTSDSVVEFTSQSKLVFPNAIEYNEGLTLSHLLHRIEGVGTIEINSNVNLDYRRSKRGDAIKSAKMDRETMVETITIDKSSGTEVIEIVATTLEKTTSFPMTTVMRQASPVSTSRHNCIYGAAYGGNAGTVSPRWAENLHEAVLSVCAMGGYQNDRALNVGSVIAILIDQTQSVDKWYPDFLNKLKNGVVDYSVLGVKLDVACPSRKALISNLVSSWSSCGDWQCLGGKINGGNIINIFPQLSAIGISESSLRKAIKMIKKEVPSNEKNFSGIKLMVEAENDRISPNELRTKVSHYLQSLIAHRMVRAKWPESEISIVKLRFEEKIEEISNPEYEEFEKRQARLMQLAKPSVSASDKTPGTSDGLDTAHPIIMKGLTAEAPPRMIKKVTVTPKVETRVIRKFAKPMDTLYLREKDTKRLINMLKSYKKRDTVFKEFGIPKKMGILAHGKPGTGKSTMIHAIATYLGGYDIKWVDLDGCKTNEHLQMLFDAATKESANGSIIVLEELDAKTPIVHRRDTKTYDRMMAGMDSGDMSLDYLLNLLDGTLCAENTIFVITTNHKEKLDPALYRAGRVDVDIDFKLCDRYQIFNIYKRIIGRKLSDEILMAIPEDTYTPAEVIFHLLQRIHDEAGDDRELMKEFIKSPSSVDNDVTVGTDGESAE